MILLIALLACAGAGLAGSADYVTAVIDGKTADRVHLRERPTAESKSLGLYFTGTTVLCESDPYKEWLWVVIGTQGGYMKAEYLYRGSDSWRVASQQPSGVVNNTKGSNWVNLRADPSTGAAVASRVYNGDVAIVLGETQTKWYYVQVGDLYGYILADYLYVSALDGPIGSIRQGAGGQTGQQQGTPSATAAFSAYQSILHNSATFFYADENRTVDLPQFLRSLSDAYGFAITVTQLAVIDLDYDGVPEVVLGLSKADDYLILRHQSGVVYGYELGYRSFMDLKSDGTFSYASSAADGGFGSLKFSGNAYTIDEITHSDSVYGPGYSFQGISYTVNKKPATQAQFDAALDAQFKKPAAAFYEFSDRNIGALLTR